MASENNSFGITYPPVDELLTKVGTDEQLGSKFALAAYGAARARQIVSYYSQLSDGLLENVGPLVDYYQQEKALSIAMREIHQDKLDLKLGEEVAAIHSGEAEDALEAELNAQAQLKEQVKKPAKATKSAKAVAPAKSAEAAPAKDVTEDDTK